MTPKQPSTQPSQKESSAQDTSTPMRLRLDGSSLRRSVEGSLESNLSHPSRQKLSLREIPSKERRVLNFDIETRRVGYHSGGRFKPDGCEPISIALSWHGSRRVRCKVIKQYQDVPHVCEWFRSYYNAADMVVGHYIGKFDLPLVNMALIEWGREPLTPKLVHDTKRHLIDFEGISKSQENLGEMLRGQEGKFKWSDAGLRRISRLTPTGLDLARKRAIQDVRQNKEMYGIMMNRGLLRPPKMWVP